jgi:hypothetical protein
MKALEILIKQVKNDELLLHLICNFKVSSGYRNSIPKWKKILHHFETSDLCETEIKNDAVLPLAELTTAYFKKEVKPHKMESYVRLLKKERSEAENKFINTLKEIRYNSSMKQVVIDKKEVNNELNYMLFSALKSYIGDQFGQIVIRNNETILDQKKDNGQALSLIDKNKIAIYKVDTREKIHLAVAELIYYSKKYRHAKENLELSNSLIHQDRKRSKETVIDAINEVSTILENNIESSLLKSIISEHYSFPEHIKIGLTAQFHSAVQTYNRGKDNNRNRKRILTSRSK